MTTTVTSNRRRRRPRLGYRWEGINEDGYFGDADGAWVPSDRVSLVLMQRERERERTTDAIEDFKVVFERFGWPIAASAFCVFLIVFAIEVFNGRTHEPSGTP